MTVHAELGLFVVLAAWVMVALVFGALFGWSEARRKRRRANAD